MHNYKCSCHIENKSYYFLTVGCSTTSQAFEQLNHWLYDNHGAHLELADGIVIDKVEADADL